MNDYGPDGRNESPQEKADRKWGDILQELRVMQTGVQLLAGFLLTLPFQDKFELSSRSTNATSTSRWSCFPA